MKKAFGLSLALILILLFSVSCGISQDKYDKVNSSLAAAQVQIQKLQGDITAKDASLAAAQAQIQKLQGDITAKDTTLKAANDKMGKAKAEVEIFNAIFIPAMTGELNNMSEAEGTKLFLGLRDKVVAIGDPLLTTKIQAVIDSGSNEATLAFFQYLLEDIARTVQ
jgi:septal ring factor EnvC (AmiA/AmiB activator)